MYKLLSVSSDAKTVKGEEFGFLTGILYLAPHTLASPKTLCPYATQSCIKDCLFQKGRAEILPAIIPARIRKTRYFLENREAFFSDLRSDIRQLIRKAKRLGLIPVVRLNGTSDVLWEKFSIIQEFPDVQFYDYTKIPLRYRRNLPSNYHLTFSLSESNQDDAIQALNAGFNVAAVFRTKLFPTSFLGRPVVDGDLSDLRFLDSKSPVNDGRGMIVALSLKGIKESPSKKSARIADGFIN